MQLKFNDLFYKADLIDDSPIRGCFTIKPYGFKIWENIQNILNNQIKELGYKNAYFPLFIPATFLKKEQEHFSGFSPEIALCTYAGGKNLTEPLAIRPTSETIMYYHFSRWIKSYRDLPLKINQWANVVRWELRPRPFLRTVEFLWHEAHAVFADQDSANKGFWEAVEIYRNFLKNHLCLYFIEGFKTEFDKFPGAHKTYSFEGYMLTNKFLQLATVHSFKTNFSKMFNITFQDKDTKLKHPHQISFGLTTRLIGAIVLMHSDNKGLVLPVSVAPLKVVIIPILSKNPKLNCELINYANKIKSAISKIFNGHDSVSIDADHNTTAGFKFNQYDLKGVPFKIAIGQKELQEQTITLKPRLGDSITIKACNLKQTLENAITQLKNKLYYNSKNFLESNIIHEIDSFEEFKTNSKTNKPITAYICSNPNCHNNIKQTTQYSSRVILKTDSNNKSCIICKSKTNTKLVLFGKAY